MPMGYDTETHALNVYSWLLWLVIRCSTQVIQVTIYTVSQKTSKIIFVITTSNFNQIWQFFGTMTANFLKLY